MLLSKLGGTDSVELSRACSGDCLSGEDCCHGDCLSLTSLSGDFFSSPFFSPNSHWSVPFLSGDFLGSSVVSILFCISLFGVSTSLSGGGESLSESGDFTVIFVCWRRRAVTGEVLGSIIFGVGFLTLNSKELGTDLVCLNSCRFSIALANFCSSEVTSLSAIKKCIFSQNLCKLFNTNSLDNVQGTKFKFEGNEYKVLETFINTYSTNTTLLPCRCMTLKWRHNDILTSHRHHFDVMCLLGRTKTGV